MMFNLGVVLVFILLGRKLFWGMKSILSKSPKDSEDFEEKIYDRVTLTLLVLAFLLMYFGSKT